MHVAFLCICLLAAAFNWNGLHAWLQMSASSERGSDYWVIPLISLFLCHERRRAIFASTEVTPAGLVPFILGIGVSAISLTGNLTREDVVVPAILGVVISASGAFLLCYGKKAWRAARFPLGFLLFAVPLPQKLWAPLVHWLQWGSAAVVDLIFTLLNVPFVRDGLRFDLSNLSIEIAPECSGIRSSFALMVLTVLLSYKMLNSIWRRLVLVAAVIPLVLVKNGIRIATISLLASRVDPSFISGSLHRQGGFVFFGLVLVAECVLCWLLWRSERRTMAANP